VVVPFPFSDLTHSKRRPALVVAELEGDDLILCQITSQRIRDEYAVSIEESDFEDGTLRQKSNVRPKAHIRRGSAHHLVSRWQSKLEQDRRGDR